MLFCVPLMMAPVAFQQGCPVENGSPHKQTDQVFTACEGQIKDLPCFLEYNGPHTQGHLSTQTSTWAPILILYCLSSLTFPLSCYQKDATTHSSI